MSDENFQVKFFLFQISSEKFSEIIENSYTVVNYKKENSYYIDGKISFYAKIIIAGGLIKPIRTFLESISY